MNKITVYVLLGIFAFVLLSNSAVSTLWYPEAREIPFQVNHSDRIVIGTVKELHPSFEYTDVTISVDEWLKNPLPKNEITVRTEQGTVAITMGAANFSKGEKVLLMLNDDDIEKDRFKIAFMELGKHPVSDRDGVTATLIKLASSVATTPPKPETSGFEKKVLVVGDTWGKDGWNLSVKAVDKKGSSGFVLISVSYQGKQLGDAMIETGKSYTYKGKNPDSSEVPLLTIKESNIFVGASADAVLLEINRSIPGSDVQIIEVPVESEQMKAETPAPAPQASPEAPGFEMVFGIIGVLAVFMILNGSVSIRRK